MLSDIRYVVRSLIHVPWFSVGTLITFALGVGMNAAVFAVVDRILFRPLPFTDPDRLATVHPVNPQTKRVYFTLPKALAVEAKRDGTLIDDFAFAGNSRPYFLEGLDNRPLRLTEASFNVLDVLGVRPILGRSFTHADAAARLRLVLLREEVWRGQYGSHPDILHRRFGDRLGPAEVVGVLPAGFVVPSVNWATPSDGLLLRGELLDAATSGEGIPAIVARLRPGATVSQAQEQFDVLTAATQDDLSGSPRTHVLVEPLQRGMFWNCRVPLEILFAGGLLVWLVACANLGSLMAARARAREHQVAIRTSLGASRGRIVSLIAIESVLLCGAGTALALLVLIWTMSGLAAVISSFIQPLVLTSVDSRIIAFMVVAALVGSALAAVYPVWVACRIDTQSALQRVTASSRMPHRRGRVLVVAESAVGTVLVLAGGLAIQSLVGLLETDLGFNPDGLYVASVRLPLPGEPDARVARFQQIVETFRAQPDVVAASAVDAPLATGELPPVATDAEGHPFVRRRVFDQYFDVMRTRLLAGRFFSDPDRRAVNPVAIMSASAVRLTWPNLALEEALGRDIRLNGEPVRQLIGIVADTRPRHGLPVQAEVFTLAGRDLTSMPAFLVRARDRRPLQGDVALRTAFQRAHGSSARLTLAAVSGRLDPWLQDPKLYARVFGAFGVTGLVLSAIGLFALTGYNASSRRHEIGVRLTLGASPERIERMLVTEAIRPVAVGVALGIGVSTLAARMFESLLYGVDARNMVAYVIVAFVLLVTAAISAWRPAHDAGMSDPLIVLRTN